jgi:alpha-L-rhamnosidase
MGATTIWERWDGIKPDGTFQTPGMNSFNHYAYGAIGDWMYRVATGIDTEESAPGYKSIVIKPHLDNRLTQASSEYKTGYGLVKSSWKTSDTQNTFEFIVPANTRAVVSIPSNSIEAISESGKPILTLKDMTVKGLEGNYVRIEVGSGSYSFVVKK